MERKKEGSEEGEEEKRTESDSRLTGKESDEVRNTGA